MREKVEKLLIGLRELEATGTSLPLDEFLQALKQKTGHEPSTLKTYLTKNLHGALVHEDAAGKLQVRGAQDLDEETFALLMTQNNLLKDAMQNKLSWLSVLRAVAAVGVSRGHAQAADIGDLARPPIK